MAIASGVILPWLGTHAGVPSGFTRETTLDDKYPLGSPASTNPDVTGGAATHTHTTSHTHTVGSHTHTGGTTGNSAGTASDNAGATNVAKHPHTHTTSTTGGQTTTLDDDGNDVTASGSSLPSSYGVIWIESDGSPAGVPNGGWALWADTTGPTDWAGEAGPAGLYLVGSAAAADAGTASGSATHLHAGTAHTHVIADHTHTGGNTGTPSATVALGAGASGHAGATHTHAVTVAVTASSASGSQTSGNSGSADVAPAYHKLGVIVNNTGGASAPIGIIGAWLGTLASIPTGWVLCDGLSGTPDLRDKMILGAAADLTDAGGTGGATSHDHTDPATHTHTTAHTHTTTIGAESASTNAFTTGFAVAFATTGHIHTGATTGSGGPASGATAEAIASATEYPPYRTVAWIQFQEAEVNVSITSVTATATATANAPTPTVAPNSVTATATATANAPTMDHSLNAVTATAVAAANNPVPALLIDSVQATATGAANSPTPALGPEAVTATSSAVANAPGTSLSLGSTTATATATAHEPSPTIAVNGVTAEAAATANAPTTFHELNSVAATATATANAPTPTLLTLSVTATATAEANAPTLFVLSGPAQVEIDIGSYRVTVHLPNTADATVEIGNTYALQIAEIVDKDALALGIADTYRLEITMSSEESFVGTAKSVTGTFTVVDGGAAVDPTTVTAKAVGNNGNGPADQPAGSYVYGTDAEVTKSATGIYVLTFTPDREGDWTVAFKGTGTAAVVNQDKFYAKASIFD